MTNCTLFCDQTVIDERDEPNYAHETGNSLSLTVPVDITEPVRIDACFGVSALAATTIGAVGSAVAGLVGDVSNGTHYPRVQVNQRRASLWFQRSLYPVGWALPPAWDTVAGDYKARDGWIKLHTNLAHHRKAALTVLDVREQRENVAAAVAQWSARELERAIVNQGGVAAAMRSQQEWENHPQGIAVKSEPLIAWGKPRDARLRFSPSTDKYPLNGLRVLDLTRVLAGPVATRTLAGFGADVLRIDPYGWDEPSVVPDITLGKRCANLDLRQTADREAFVSLLQAADVLIHGYRPGALDRLGFSERIRTELAPNLIEVSLDAYGWSGPWSNRRGFDSLVQMSSGIAEAGMNWAGATAPTPLPVQALDHATGYLMAAATVRLIHTALKGNGAGSARLSLARTGELLATQRQQSRALAAISPSATDFQQVDEITPWGRAKRLRPALKIEGTAIEWKRAATKLGSSRADWLPRST